MGSANAKLCYFDCFAGPGKYETEGRATDGSPIIAVKAALEVLSKKPNQQIAMLFMEKDENQVKQLEQHLKLLKPFPINITVDVIQENSHSLVPMLLESVPTLAPSFFMIDPYGHPLSLPLINKILERTKTEVLINLMWFRINMDLGNNLMRGHLNNLFGSNSWQTQSFMGLHGSSREKEFLKFLISWVIVGGESGPGARPMLKDWVVSLRNQCLDSHVPFFFKQWGGVRKKKTGRKLDGRTYDQFPARVENPMLELVQRRMLGDAFAEFHLSDFVRIKTL